MSTREYNGFSSAQRTRAGAWARRLRAMGKRPIPTACDGCGAAQAPTAKVRAHSEDYSEPFGAQTGAHHFCQRCHAMVHFRFSMPRAWARYIDCLEAGMRLEPATSNWALIRSQALELERGGRVAYSTGHAPFGHNLQDIAAGRFNPNHTETPQDGPHYLENAEALGLIEAKLGL